MAGRLVKEENILANLSSGTALATSLKVAARPENEGKMIVTILPDTGERHLSPSYFPIPDNIFTTTTSQREMISTH